jgi:glycosyltransferase involved in cell wall biosynthesis
VKTVLAHEWFVTPAGSDKVAARIASALRVERVVTAIDDRSVSGELLGSIPTQPLWTNRLPGVAENRMKYAPALLGAWVTSNIGSADLLVSSSHFGSMGAGRRFDGAHIAYCYSPLRYAWRHDLESSRLKGTASQVAKKLLPALRAFDLDNARTTSLMVAISSSIATRINETYGRPAPVVYPCVDIEGFAPIGVQRMSRDAESDFYLCFGRMVAYKRIDLAVRVCSEQGLPLVVAGDGPSLAELRRIAGPTIRFEQGVTDLRYKELLSKSRALLFPGEEDFGIVPVEAMAAGVPVVAFGAGGALDTVIDGVTGILFPEQSVESLGAALDRLSQETFHPEKLLAHSLQFRPEEFDRRLIQVISGHLASGERDSW